MEETMIVICAIWAVTGLWFVIRSGSRGIVADILFGLLWPVYWYVDWRRGLWTASVPEAIVLLSPALAVLTIASIATLSR